MVYTSYQPVPSRRRHLYSNGHLSPPLIAQQDGPAGMLPPWTIGMARPLGWRALLGRPGRPYEIDLGAPQQGVILGATESGISTSMHRLAFNAASHGWKVFLFDAQGSQEAAATFYVAMQSAGCEHIRLFPNDAYDGWQGTGSAILHRLLQVSPFREPYYQHITTAGLATVLLQDGLPVYGLDDIVERLSSLMRKRDPVRRGQGDAYHRSLFDTLRSTDLSGSPLRYQALSSLIGNSLNGFWSFDHADAAYFSFSAWNRPEEARLQARFLLADLASYLAERIEKETPVLLLIKHPEQLFDLEQIAPLFAHMERAHGSLFVAARSTADFGKAAHHLLKNASTLLVHRSLTPFPFEPYISLPLWKSHPFLNGTLQRLSDRDCFAIAEGDIAQVHIAPVPIDPDAVAYATRYLSSPPRSSRATRPLELDPFSLFDINDEDEWQRTLAELLGHGTASSEGSKAKASPLGDTVSPETSSEPVRHRRSRRRKEPFKKKATFSDATPAEPEKQQTTQEPSAAPKRVDWNHGDGSLKDL